MKAYRQSKTANVLFTLELAERLAGMLNTIMKYYLHRIEFNQIGSFRNRNYRQCCIPGRYQLSHNEAL